MTNPHPYFNLSNFNEKGLAILGWIVDGNYQMICVCVENCHHVLKMYSEYYFPRGNCSFQSGVHIVTAIPKNS